MPPPSLRVASLRSALFSALVLVALASCGERRSDGRVVVSDTDGATVIDRYAADEDSNALVLKHLGDAGSDLSKPTDIRWYVYLPSSEAAEGMRRRAREAGWRVDVRKSDEGASWLCVCSRQDVPSLDRIRAMEQKLARLAGDPAADVDGWEAAVVR